MELSQSSPSPNASSKEESHVDDLSFGNTTIDFTPSCPQIPSKVTEANFIQAVSPLRRSVSNEYRYNSCNSGKWLIFLDQRKENKKGLTRLDEGFYVIAELVAKNAIWSAKCSTAAGHPTALTPENGVIFCYTPDYSNKADVKRVAKVVQSALKFYYPMYYKTDEATLAGVYRRFGAKAVSLYKYTPGDKFYETGEKDEEVFWRPVQID